MLSLGFHGDVVPGQHEAVGGAADPATRLPTFPKALVTSQPVLAASCLRASTLSSIRDAWNTGVGKLVSGRRCGQNSSWNLLTEVESFVLRTELQQTYNLYLKF